MLYIARCKSCNFLMMSIDVLSFKQLIASHMSKSHKLDYGFVAKIPLKDFEEVNITRVQVSADNMLFREAMKSPRFWKIYRNL